MVRILGVGKKKVPKKRLSPTARSQESIRDKHPMYQYAINEYSQAVAPGTSNDDGRTVEGSSNSYEDSYPQQQQQHTVPPAPSSVAGARSHEDPLPSADSTSVRTEVESTKTTKSPSSNYSSPFHKKVATRSAFENDMPYATYEEHYGAAYTGGNIKYIYPSGYTSMRPRSCPWKLSIVVCLLFTWLSVFIVGHCADQADLDQYEYQTDDQNAGNFANADIEKRWCGSRPLYLIWAMSMLITGLSAAYCGVIGYIKCRDFAVANSRSQPPGVPEGKSDYYVRIEDGIQSVRSNDSSSQYQTTIYQADGTPQFWGSHIYRPTQAAVAITSR